MNNLKFNPSVQSPRGNLGFTLVELVSVILISAILALGTVIFISRAVEGLDATSARNQLASAGRTAIWIEKRQHGRGCYFHKRVVGETRPDG